uniref:Putative secreted protein n=1 Tax=Xenopsylla cheopis TaxID=163159 RepID=A0A6M2DZA3_XENCH
MSMKEFQCGFSPLNLGRLISGNLMLICLLHLIFSLNFPSSLFSNKYSILADNSKCRLKSSSNSCVYEPGLLISNSF